MLSFVAPLAANLYLWLWLAAAVGSWLMTRGSGRRRWATTGLIALWLLACRPVSELALWPLEGRHSQPSLADLQARGVRQVVVPTAGGYEPIGDLAGSTLTSGSAARFLGGIELCSRLAADCRLVLSGSAGRGHRELETAEQMRLLAGHLEVSLDVRAEARSGSTSEHPVNVRPLLDDEPFALVTSAYHMPRAMRSFRRAGLEPIAFPVEHHAKGRYGWSDWIPSFGALRQLEIAWREYLAFLLYTIRGW